MAEERPYRFSEHFFYLAAMQRVGDGREDDGHLYFIGGEEGPIKIGRCRGNPEGRLKDLQCGSPILLRIIHAQRVCNPQGAERELHQRLASSRSHGEWFDREVVLHLLRSYC